MFWIPVIAVGLLVLLSGYIGYGFLAGDFFEEGALLLDLVWGQVTLVDLYVGFALFAMWIAYREASFLRSLLWIVALGLLGNVTSCVYLILAWYQSRGNPDILFHGTAKR